MTFDERVTLVLATNDEDFAPLAHLGIPVMRRVDASDGLRGDTGVTAFPAPASLASTFDTDLAERYGDAIGEEARGKGWNVLLGPTVDIDRNGLSGRAVEGYGEDTLVNGVMGAAVSKGFEENGLIAQLKHFTAYNQESNRNNYIDVSISERALHEVHYPAFEQAIREGGADSVMCSYPKINGTAACENTQLLTDLKTQLGLKGYVATDFNPQAGQAASINAGVDSLSLFAGLSRDAFYDGTIATSRTNDAARRILVALFDSGAYDNPLPTKISETVTTAAHQDLARETGAASTVLLKNANGALPLSKRSTVAVIGPSGADSITGVEGSSYVNPGDFTTPLEAIQQKAGSNRVVASQGSLGDGLQLPTVPTEAFRTSSGETGLNAEFFANEDLSGAPATTTTLANADFSGAPVSSLPSKWSVRLTGTITSPDDGLVRLGSILSGTAKVRVGSTTVISGERFIWDFFFSPQVYTLDGTVRLKAGVPTPVTIEYSTKAAGFFGPRLTLGWQPKSLIPAAAAAAKKADTAVVFVNEATGEAVDRVGYSLPADQNELIEAVAAANRHTIVVLQTPGPVLMPWLAKVEGVIQAGYQGSAVGTSIADVLFGDAEPGGRLPVSFPASAQQGPTLDRTGTDVSYDEGIYVGYKWFDKHDEEPLFPFGYGLSYTSFRYSDVQVVDPKADRKGAASKDASVTVTVRNTGKRTGSDVVQVYVGSLPTHAVDTPERQLAGFEKVTLKPGQAKRVKVNVDSRLLSYWDSSNDRWVTPHGTVQVYVNRSATDTKVRTSLHVR